MCTINRVGAESEFDLDLSNLTTLDIFYTGASDEGYFGFDTQQSPLDSLP
jgi:hypothetical protein